MAQCPYRRQEYPCFISESLRNVAYCDRCLKGHVADALGLVYDAIMDTKVDKMEAEADGNKRR